MSPFLLDTHVWFWHLVGSDRLPATLRRAIDASPEDCWLSPISVWELGMLAERGRVSIEGEFRKWVALARARFPVNDAVMNLEVALKSREIELPHNGPADHFLAATALVYELTMMTLDRHLLEVDWLPTLSA